MTARPPALSTVCLIVPSGSWRIEPLVDAIRSNDPAAATVAVWCGDPHRRPVLPDGVRWADLGLHEPTGAGWNRLLIALPPRHYEWLRGLAVVRRELAGHASAVTMLRVGAVAVFDSLQGMLTHAGVSVVARSAAGYDIDGLAPTDADLVGAGRRSDAIAAFATEASEAIEWLSARLVAGTGVSVSRWLDELCARGLAVDVESDVVVAAGWSHASGRAQPAVVDLDAIDRSRPWAFDFGGRMPRERLSAEPLLARWVRDGLEQIDGIPWSLTLAGGIPVDAAMRALVASELDRWRSGRSDLPPEPYGAVGSAFLTWLEESAPGDATLGRYWAALLAERGDLAAAFPHHQSTDTRRYVEWIEDAWPVDGRTVLIRSSARTAERIPSVGADVTGINVVGFVAFDQSLGHVARQIGSALDAAAVPHVMIDHRRSMRSARLPDAQVDPAALYATNLVVVTADQFEFVVAEFGDNVLDGRRNIGYWFWELEHVPSWMVDVAATLDEVWAASAFTHDALVAALPSGAVVRHVPIRIPEPVRSHRGRADLGLPLDRFTFLVSFDQLSVPERKNPFGAIEAFSRAFPIVDQGPVLVVKTTNGSLGWANHERLLLAAAGRADIVVWDEHLSRDDHMAVVASVDCVVSLHRSEGLGMHCAEAMWFGKPVIATRYSGNLDFMDDTNSMLVDYDLVPVRHGEGIYPPDARWAEPNLDQAAAWMRRIVADGVWGESVGAAARARMQGQPSAAEIGATIAAAAGLATTGGTN